MCVFVYVETHIPWHMCEGHKTTCRSQFSSTMKILWIKLRLPGLVKSAFNHFDDWNKRFYSWHIRFCTSLHTVHIHTHPRHYIFLSPFVLYVLYTCGDELNLVSSSMAQHFIFETGSVTESEGHNWLDWSVSPGYAPALQARDTSYPAFFFHYYYEGSVDPNSGPQACGSSTLLTEPSPKHHPAFMDSLDSARDNIQSVVLPTITLSSFLLSSGSLPSRLRVLNELFDMHQPPPPL